MKTDKLWARGLTAIALGAATIALAGCSLLGQVGGGGNGDGGSGDGGTGEGTDTDAFSIAVGDCLNDASASETVSTIPVVDCSEPHDSEAYYAFDLPDGDLPADDELFAAADAGCEAEFEAYVGAALGTSKFVYSYYYPTSSSWDNGDREILCTLYDPNGQTTGSAKGSGL